MYTSIKINTGTSEVGSLIGVKIPSTLGRIEKDKTYTLQFKYIPLDNHTNLDRIKVGNQLFEPIDINTFDTVWIEENIAAKLCYITFKSDETVISPPIEIARLKDTNDTDNSYTCEITDISLSYGVLTAYTQNTIDLSVTKSILESKINSIAEGLQFSATKKDLNQLSDTVLESLGQIEVLSGEISLKVEQTYIENAINEATLSRADFIARNFLSTPLIVSDPTLPIYALSGIPNPPVGAVFGGFSQENNIVKNNNVSSNGSAWAIIVGYEFYKNTTDNDKKIKIKDMIKNIADFMVNNVSIGRFNSMDFNFIDTNYKYDSTSKSWVKSNYKEIYLSTLWLQVKAMVYAYEILKDSTYSDLCFNILDSLFNTHFYINSKVASNELPAHLEWSSYEYLACDNLSTSYRFVASTKQYANQMGYYIHQAVPDVIRVFGDNERSTPKGDIYKPSDILVGLKKYLKNAYDTQNITAKPLGLPYGYFHRVKNGSGGYDYIPQNWNFIENTWGDGWFVGDVVTYTIYAFAASGLTDIAREYADNYYKLRVNIKDDKWSTRFNSSELIFYDRMDFYTGDHLPGDNSISITYTALYYEILKQIGKNEHIDACCYTLAKHQINNLDNKNIDGGYSWDISRDDSSLEFKSFGEIINSQFYKNLNITSFTAIDNKFAEIKVTTDSISQKVSSVESTTNGKVSSLETRMSSAEQKITSDAIVSTVTSSQVYKDNLSEKVSSYEIISKINQTPEGVFIEASRLELTGVSRNLCSLIPGESFTAHKSTAEWNSTLWEWKVTGDYVPLTQQYIPNTLTYNDTIVIDFECYAASNMTLTPKIYLYDNTKKNIGSYTDSLININTEWGKYTSKIKLDTNIGKATYVFIGFSKDDSSKIVHIRNAFVRKAIGSELIVDGSIKAKHISTNESMAIFNKNGLAELTSTALNFKKSNGKRYMSMENGRFNLFTEGSYLGSLVDTSNTTYPTYKGVSLFGGYPCYYMDFGVDYSCKNPTDNFSYNPLMRLVFYQMPNAYSNDLDKTVLGRKGVHFYNEPVSYHTNAYMNGYYMYTHYKRWDAMWANNDGTYLGSQSRLMFGLMSGNPTTSTNKVLLEITPAGLSNAIGGIASTDGIDAYAWIDMHGYDIWNTQIKTSSDINLKQDIRYLKDNINRNIPEITEASIYDSFKNDIDFAEYRYIQEVKSKGEDAKVKVGFLANDLEGTLIGNITLEKDEATDFYSYDQSNYINCIAIALQQEMKKRDKENQELKLEIESLKSQVNELLNPIILNKQ